MVNNERIRKNKTAIHKDWRDVDERAGVVAVACVRLTICCQASIIC